MTRAEGRATGSAASNTEANSSLARVLAGQDGIKDWQEDVYRRLHQHPELSDEELNTAATAANALREAGYEVHD
jgi:hippurate hydrolase